MDSLLFEEIDFDPLVFFDFREGSLEDDLDEIGLKMFDIYDLFNLLVKNIFRKD
jgi:hypothetical protein